MAEERTRFWSQIDGEYYDFERGLFYSDYTKAIDSSLEIAEIDAQEIEGMTLSFSLSTVTGVSKTAKESRS